jgi:REase associating with pPIWI_RE
MSDFVKIFNEAMELSCLGIYEKHVNEVKSDDQMDYFRSPLLKKALDKFSLLNLYYNLFDKNGEPILPTSETALIKSFNFSTKQFIDRLPDAYRKPLTKTDWYMDESYVNIGFENTYHCTPELLDKLNERIFRKAKKAKYKELELQSQKFIELLFEKNQDEYCEIRSFLQHTPYITSKHFIENESLRNFRTKYPDIFEAAFERLNHQYAMIKVCKHCGLILKERIDGTLYCVSDRCSRKTNGFSDIKKVNAEGDIWVLRLNVARYIYYSGLLEKEIKKILLKVGIKPTLWPKKDEWDFEFNFKGEKWVIDAKDVKDPRWIQEDIKLKEKENLPYDKVIYVVPSDKNSNYIRAVNRVVKDKMKIQCMTLASFKKMIKEWKDESE